MQLKGLSEEQQRIHAKAFDETLAMLGKLHDEQSLTAVAVIHAGIFFLARKKSRREIYNWLQRICDGLVV